MTPSSSRLLTRHFFRGLFDFGILNERGAEAFVRVITGILAAIFCGGLFLARMYMGKYAALRAAGDAELYRQALAADDALVIGLPMWILGFVTVLVSHSLFPDETDFRVLVPLPIGRRLIFGSKLSALGLFAGVFIATTIAATLPLMLLLSVAQRAGHAFSVRFVAYLVSSVGGCAFAVFGVAAAVGVAGLLAPRAHAHGASAGARSIALGGLVLLLPLVLRLPTIGPAIGSHSASLYWLPPAWFLGFERTLLGEGDPFFMRLAALAGLGLAGSTAIVAGAYVFMYTRFDRAMLRPIQEQKPRGEAARKPRPGRREYSVSATPAFVLATLRRSALHQGVVVGLSACGVALVVNSIAASDLARWYDEAARTRLLYAATWAPFALVFVMAIAVKASIALPIEPRANWIFRITESDATRESELRSVEQTMWRLAVAPPIAVFAPVQLALAGPRAIVVPAVAAAFGVLLTEVLLRDWRRIPFTCSYLPGKQSVTYTSVVAFASFMIFTGVGSAVARIGVLQPRPALIVIGVLSVPIAVLRRQRLQLWRHVPLMFDDRMPDEIQAIELLVR